MRSRYARARELTLMQYSELKLGPPIPQYMDNHEPIVTTEEGIAVFYERQPRRGFRTFGDLKAAWREHGDQLMAEDPGSWWAWRQWSNVTVNDLVGDDKEEK